MAAARLFRGGVSFSRAASGLPGSDVGGRSRVGAGSQLGAGQLAGSELGAAERGSSCESLWMPLSYAAMPRWGLIDWARFLVYR